MAKKGENIYKRKDGRWEGRYIKSRNKTGRINYGSIYGKTYTEVKRKLTILKANNSDPHVSISPYVGSYSNWLTYWMTTKVKHEVKVTTYSNYQRLINKHIVPELGNKTLTMLTHRRLQNFVYELESKNLTTGSIRNVFNLIKNSLVEAKARQFIASNPCDHIQLPQSIKKEVKVLTLQEQRKIEFIAFQGKGCSAVILALYSGMRIGEISGLKWKDIDFVNNLIHVKRTVSRVSTEGHQDSKTRLIEGTPKSAHSIRQIPLAKNLKNYLLKKQLDSQSDYVISINGKQMEPRTISNRFKKVIKEAGVKEFNFHVLRHTFATRCLEQKVDIVSLSRILGHQSTKMTLDTYTGSLLETRRKAMAKLDNLLLFDE